MISGSTTTTRGTITTAEIAEFIGKTRTSARRLLNILEAAGLKRKGLNRGTHYSRIEFLKAYEAYDTRP